MIECSLPNLSAYAYQSNLIHGLYVQYIHLLSREDIGHDAISKRARIAKANPDESLAVPLLRAYERQAFLEWIQMSLLM